MGNLLGAGFPATARLTGRISVVMGVAFMCVAGVLLLTLRSQLGLIFTQDPDIQHLMYAIAPIAALFQVCAMWGEKKKDKKTLRLTQCSLIYADQSCIYAQQASKEHSVLVLAVVQIPLSKHCI